MSKTCITNCLMKLLFDTTRSRPEVIVRLMIIMIKFVSANRRNRSMKSFCKLEIKTIWERQQKTDSLLQRCLMNICVIFKDGILRYGYFLRTCTWMKRHRIYILILYHIRQEAKEDSIQEFL